MFLRECSWTAEVEGQTGILNSNILINEHDGVYDDYAFIWSTKYPEKTMFWHTSGALCELEYYDEYDGTEGYFVHDSYDLCPFVDEYGWTFSNITYS